MEIFESVVVGHSNQSIYESKEGIPMLSCIIEWENTAQCQIYRAQINQSINQPAILLMLLCQWSILKSINHINAFVYNIFKLPYL